MFYFKIIYFVIHIPSIRLRLKKSKNFRAHMDEHPKKHVNENVCFIKILIRTRKKYKPYA